MHLPTSTHLPKHDLVHHKIHFHQLLLMSIFGYPGPNSDLYIAAITVALLFPVAIVINRVASLFIVPKRKQT